MRRKNCAICSSAIPVNTASSASSRSEIMKIMPTQRVDRPAITAIIPSLLSKKANTTHTIPDPRARYRGMSYRTCALVASPEGLPSLRYYRNTNKDSSGFPRLN